MTAMYSAIQRITALTVMLVAGLLIAQPAQAQLGASVGLNFNELGDIESGNREATLDNATGWHVELWYRLVLGPVGIQPGLRYMDAGSLYSNLESEGSIDPSDFNVNMVEVPIDLIYQVSAPLIAPYISAGPVFRLPMGLDEAIEDNFKTMSVAGSVGAGVRLGLGPIRLYPELKYVFGISKITDGFEVEGYSFAADEGQNLSAIMLRLGIAF